MVVVVVMVMMMVVVRQILSPVERGRLSARNHEADDDSEGSQ